MPKDTVRPTKPTLVHLDPVHWAEFKRIAGHRAASMMLRRMIRREIIRYRKANRPASR